MYRNITPFDFIVTLIAAGLLHHVPYMRLLRSTCISKNGVKASSQHYAGYAWRKHRPQSLEYCKMMLGMEKINTVELEHVEHVHIQLDMSHC